MRKYLKQGKYSYQPSEKLGQGGFGKVYKGYNHHSQQWVALKQIQLKTLSQFGEQLKQIVLSQITVMRKFSKNMINNPCEYIVKHQDCFRTQQYIYIVMELCSGGTLEDLIKKNKFKREEQCRYVIYCIASGLNYMNQMGIVHRDLKPENIFLFTDPMTKKKYYKIGDFGFASYKKQLDIAMGTFPYMAPEMFTKGIYTNKVDIWSLGVLSYEIYFNELYFKAKDKWQFQKNIKEKPFILSEKQKKQISQDYANVLQLCLIKNPQFRISSQNLLKHNFLIAARKKIQQQNNKIQQKSPQNTVPMNSFDKIRLLIDQCKKLWKMAQQFDNFSQVTGRYTQFIQIYLLKDSYVMMNRIAYTMMHRQDYIGMSPQEFEQLISSKNQQTFNTLSTMSQNQCIFVAGLFNEKYKQFSQQYIAKFEKQDTNLIIKVVNQQPYEYTNEKVFEEQLKKWVQAFKKYQKFTELKANCQRVYQLKKSANQD